MYTAQYVTIYIYYIYRHITIYHYSIKLLDLFIPSQAPLYISIAAQEVHL